jgi:hypothetical protein
MNPDGRLFLQVNDLTRATPRLHPIVAGDARHGPVVFALLTKGPSPIGVDLAGLPVTSVVPPEPLPAPTGPSPYRLDLAAVLDPARMQAITDTGRMTFHLFLLVEFRVGGLTRDRGTTGAVPVPIEAGRT